MDKPELKPMFSDYMASFNYPAMAPLYERFVALLDGIPVAAAAVSHDDGSIGDGTAGLFEVATLPQYRGKGVGFAICRHCVVETRARGTKSVLLGSSVKGTPLYARLNFQKLQKSFYWMF